uniref:Uncharacterized protein n=1 Tax=Plectus sambesii TaxID=2011161 RepID=A0A914XMK8_9BILA
MQRTRSVIGGEPSPPINSAEMEPLIGQCSEELGKFHFDAAREVVDTFRNRRQPVLVDARDGGWHCLLSAVVQLTQVEKTYFSLAFLLPRAFFRGRERSNYNQIRTELLHGADTLKAALAETSPTSETAHRTDSLAEHLLRQFHGYVCARIDMMNFYERLATIGTVKGMSSEQAFMALMDIQQKNTGTFHHPQLSPLDTSFTYEIEVLSHLLQCQSDLVKLRFMPSLLHLKEAKERLKLWLKGTNLESSQLLTTGWLGLGSAKKLHSHLALCVWMQNFYDLLMAKFSLYFYDALVRQTNAAEMKLNVASVPLPNFLTKFANFQRRHDALTVCLILNRDEEPLGFAGVGYHHPEKYVTEGSKGLADTYPIIFNQPPEKPPERLHPSLARFIEEARDAVIGAPDRVKHLYDHIKDQTFYAAHIEGQLYLAVVFLGRRQERDSAVISFFAETLGDLRVSRIFNSLKTAAKS